ncbi:hypothetical protein [Sphingosinicella sp. BN140058]|uniref:hypothetical protein n=1 Tax=Sphingosinicella sp. BN140058 TaxID=1892855 RepID=UPI001011F55A|nr:hypothetical protein [Sphingosinicella sp. BN140058]QAY77924.1 hypothetical protein ETR14_16390 [Sphingosinicella sp. BN140058]
MATGTVAHATKDGRTLLFFYDFDALVLAEDAADMALSDLLASMASGSPRMKVVRSLIWAGLRTFQEEISLKDVGALMLSEGDALGAAMGKAITAAMPQLKPAGGAAKTENPRKPASKARQAGTGTRSSARGSRKV